MSIDFSKIKTDRLDLWRATIDAELQQAITTASELRQKIADSKTTTKRDYYNKKFQKISDTVMQLIAVKSQLPPASADTSTPSEPVSTTSSEQPSTVIVKDPLYVGSETQGTSVDVTVLPTT